MAKYNLAAACGVNAKHAILARMSSWYEHTHYEHMGRRMPAHLDVRVNLYDGGSFCLCVGVRGRGAEARSGHHLFTVWCHRVLPSA